MRLGVIMGVWVSVTCVGQARAAPGIRVRPIRPCGPSRARAQQCWVMVCANERINDHMAWIFDRIPLR